MFLLSIYKREKNISICSPTDFSLLLICLNSYMAILGCKGLGEKDYLAKENVIAMFGSDHFWVYTNKFEIPLSLKGGESARKKKKKEETTDMQQHEWISKAVCSEKSQIQKATCYMIQFMAVLKQWNYRDRTQISGFQKLELGAGDWL